MAGRVSVRDEPRLLERESELEAVGALLAEARAGRGALVVVEGPAGIGKTRLLGAARDLAAQAGMNALGASGSALEREFSYGVVRQLFDPVLARAPITERGELLDGAASVAGALFPEPNGVERLRARGDSTFAVLHGLFWLTANMAARRPLALAVDDLHWADTPSLRWLAYLARRLEGLPIVLFAGLRPDERGGDARLIAELGAAAEAVLRPTALSVKAVELLVRESLRADADSAFCEACAHATGGNPLLLRHVLASLVAESVEPTSENVDRVHELGVGAVSRSVRIQFARLPAEASVLARAVAVLGDGVEPRQAAALADLEQAAAADTAATLARAGLLRRERLAFEHPLVRAAVYEELTASEREQAHARAAAVLADDRAPAEEIAAHLLLTSPCGAEFVVETLRRAAGGSLARAAPENAVAYLERALVEPPEQNARADVLVELALAERYVDGPAAARHLEEAIVLIQDPRRRAEIGVELVARLLFAARPEAAAEAAARARGDAQDVPELRRRLDALLVNVAILEPSFSHLAEEALAETREQPEREGLGARMLLALLAFHDARRGVPVHVSVERARGALTGDVLLSEEMSLGPSFLAVHVLTLADADDAVEVIDAALAEAHRHGSVFAFAGAKCFRGAAFLARGALREAVEDVSESLEACERWGVWFAPPWVAAYLAEALMEQGRLDDAEAALSRVGLGEEVPDNTAGHWFLQSRGRLRVLRGAVRQGLDDLLELGRRLEAIEARNPAFFPWRSYASAALVALDRPDEAEDLVAAEVDLARRWGAPAALGRALRQAALVDRGSAGIELLREAVSVLEPSPARLEHAKAVVELGAALRRTNRRAEARDPLRWGLELATACGAAALARHAETELLATGARPRRIALSGVASLTPSERRVADLAVEGQTNREIAQALFVTQKTVEVHLSSVYRKLGLTSRSQLPAVLTDSDA